jgi:hypothetical protein
MSEIAGKLGNTPPVGGVQGIGTRDQARDSFIQTGFGGCGKGRKREQKHPSAAKAEIILLRLWPGSSHPTVEDLSVGTPKSRALVTKHGFGIFSASFKLVPFQNVEFFHGLLSR